MALPGRGSPSVPLWRVGDDRTHVAVVFVGEVFIAAFILIMTRRVRMPLDPIPPPKLDIVGSVLSAAGLGVFVFGVLQSSTWGWVKPKNSPITIFGFSLTLFVLAAGWILSGGS